MLVGKKNQKRRLDLLSGQGKLENTTLFYGAYFQQQEERGGAFLQICHDIYLTFLQVCDIVVATKTYEMWVFNKVSTVLRTAYRHGNPDQLAEARVSQPVILIPYKLGLSFP